MVFWLGLLKRLRQAVSRKDFNALKNVVDTNTANIANKANTADVVLKNNTANLTIDNTRNTIIRGAITNISSTTGDIELRAPAGKGIDIGQRPIFNAPNPVNNTEVANKEYVDNAINNVPAPDLNNYYTKSETYNRTEIDNAINNIPAPDLTNYYTKSEVDSKDSTINTRVDAVSARLTSVDEKAERAENTANANTNRFNNYYTSSTSDGRYVSLNSDQDIRGRKRFYYSIDCWNEKILNVANPVSDTDAANKRYVDSEINKIPISLKTTDIRFTCRDKSVSGAIAKFFFVQTGSGTIPEKSRIRMVQSLADLTYYVPCKWEDNYFDLIANAGDFSNGYSGNFRIFYN